MFALQKIRYWWRSKSWVSPLPYIIMAILALRVVWWLPAGFSPDGSNSFSPLMPVFGSPLNTAYPWNSMLENGFPNPQIPRFLESLPFFALSGLGLDTWTAQVVWLFILYWVGASFAILAARELYPDLGKSWWKLVLVGAAYQLAPSLMFGLQDTAAYGLPIATYWGIPLLSFFALRTEASRSPIYSIGTGFSFLVLMMEFPATLVPTILLATFLLIIAMVRRRTRAPLRTLVAPGAWSLGWICAFNIWWFVPEFQYRSALLTNLATSVPTGTVYPNHLANLLYLNWSWPPATAYLTYLSSPAAEVSAFLLLMICMVAIFDHVRTAGGLTIFAFWLITLLLVYGSASPFDSAYTVLFRSTTLAYLIRNSVHFVPLFNLLFSALFAVGAGWIVRQANQRVETLLNSRKRRTESKGTARPRNRTDRVRRSKELASQFAIVAAFSAILIVASLPLINGDVLENVTFTGTEVLPVEPLQRGVEVPSYYYQARSWLASNFPNDPTMVFPMPDTWLSADSHLSWGYEGSSAIYETLLGEPLISNNAGTLTAPEFPAIESAYSIAAAGGPPGSALNLQMNSTTYLWPGFTKDSLAFESRIGPGGSAGYNWSSYLGTDYGLNGHQFTWYIPASLPENTSYLGFWLRQESPGIVSFTWSLNQTAVGWYQLNDVLDSWVYVVIATDTPPLFNYYPDSLNVSEFPRATSFTFKFQPSGPLVNSSATTEIADFAAYTVDPAGLQYYVISLGVRTVIVDRSIVASAKDPLQNLTTYRSFLSAIQGWTTHSFGNLTIYDVPNPLQSVSVVSRWSNSTSYLLAWSDRAPETEFFALNPPSWLPQISSPASLSFVEQSPASYQLTVHSSGPFIVALLQNYNPLWTASISGQPLTAHFTIDGYANAWLVNRSGTFQMSITFQPAETFAWSIAISVAGAVGLFVAAIPTIRSRLRSAFARAFRGTGKTT